MKLLLFVEKDVKIMDHDYEGQGQTQMKFTDNQTYVWSQF